MTGYDGEETLVRRTEKVALPPDGLYGVPQELTSRTTRVEAARQRRWRANQDRLEQQLVHSTRRNRVSGVVCYTGPATRVRTFRYLIITR